jgi:hypothetical protein
MVAREVGIARRGQSPDCMQGGFSALRAEVESLNQRTDAQMRLLFEKLVSRIAAIDEGRAAAPK